MVIDEKSPISRELVVSAYQVLLGRDPENEQVVREKVEQHRSIRDLLYAFVNSVEFNNKRADRDYASEIDAGYHSASNQIEVDVSPAEFALLFERVRDQWTALGNSEPYWSVVSHDRFRMSNIERTKDEFFASGARSAQLIDVFCQRTNLPIPSGTCFELGCGVGRVTRFLAERFDHVIGVDISQGNLDVARTHLRHADISNVDLILLQDLKQLEDMKAFDFFYSVIVLQHNPPPIMAEMLRLTLKN